MWNYERTLGLGLFAVAAIAAWGISDLPFWEEFTLGPGAAPAIYLVGLGICALAIAARPAADSVVRFPALFMPPNRDALLLFVFVALLTASVYLVGFAVGIFLFSVAVLMTVQRWRLLPALVFSAVWAAALQLVFAHLLRIPFLTGVLFG
jgi:hypothetical protein